MFCLQIYFVNSKYFFFIYQWLNYVRNFFSKLWEFKNFSKEKKKGVMWPFYNEYLILGKIKLFLIDIYLIWYKVSTNYITITSVPFKIF